jgi:hypothetical protein
VEGADSDVGEHRGVRVDLLAAIAGTKVVGGGRSI